MHIEVITARTGQELIKLLFIKGNFTLFLITCYLQIGLYNALFLNNNHKIHKSPLKGGEEAGLFGPAFSPFLAPHNVYLGTSVA